MATQTYSGLTAQQRTFYEGALLKRLLPYIPMMGEGQKGTIPKHQGMQAQWRAFASLSLATSSLPEGVPPTDSSLSISTVTATVLQYGAWVKLSDLVVHQGIDNVWTETAGLLGEQAGRSIHTVLVNVLAAGTTVQYASTAVSRVTVTNAMLMTSAEIREAVATLKTANVEPFPDGYYHALTHPRTSEDIQGDSLWQDVAKYVGGQAPGGGPNILRGEIGRIHGARFMESTDAPIFAAAGSGGIDVYGTLIYGPGWFGQRSLAAQATPMIDPKTGLGVRVTDVPVDTPSKDDPLGQFGVMGWKTTFVAKILQEVRGVRIEHAAA